MRRKRKRKGTKRLGKISIIYITAIFMLNLVGISYAYWNDSVDIATSISTGSIEPYFDFGDSVGDGDIQVDLRNNGRTMVVRGRMEPGRVKIKYDVQNSGNVPVKFVKEKYDKKEGKKLKYKLNQPCNKIDGKNDFGNDNSTLKINAREEGHHKFEIDLLFKQCF